MLPHLPPSLPVSMWCSNFNNWLPLPPPPKGGGVNKGLSMNNNISSLSTADHPPPIPSLTNIIYAQALTLRINDYDDVTSVKHSKHAPESGKTKNKSSH